MNRIKEVLDKKELSLLGLQKKW
jgi:hypothetical protein